MPRGFLVKRTHRQSPVSYRIRTPQDDVLPLMMLPPGGPAHRKLPRGGAPPESQAPSQNPLRLVSIAPLASSLDRGLNLGSPAPGESAPACPSQSLGLASTCAAGKQAKILNRKAGVGSREAALDPAASLGGFVCQLCQETYPGPLALAQHCCSRIARVEYRCHECSKAFNCPANLASHRRWHKPRGGGGGCTGHVGGTKENESPEPAHGPGASLRPGATDSSYGCAQCPKRFRRRASLCKHLALHSATGTAVLSESQHLHSNLALHCPARPKKAF